MKAKAFLLAGLILIFSLIGCNNLLNPPASPGSLTITVSDGVSRTLLPSLSMDPAEYLVTGAGPDGASFEETITGSSLTIEGLAFGEWNVTITAYNLDGTAIGAGSGTVIVHSNQSSLLAVTVRPYEGFGTLTLSLAWNSGDVDIPQVEATLLPAEGAVRTLDFTISGSTATFTADDIPAGYHTLSLRLLDNGALTMGAVEIVRIVADQTTEGDFFFDQINQPGGGIVVEITPEMGDPLDVNLTGAEETKPENQSLTLNASVTGYAGNVTYVWYINGETVDTGESFVFGTSYAQGYYRIDVTAYSADGSRAGSATAFIEVVEPVVTDAFVSTWKTDNPGGSGNNQIALPLVDIGTYDFVVDWGDGTQDTITAWNDAARIHSYAAVGTYEVSITGVIEGWMFYTSEDPEKILDISSWGPLCFGDTTYQFSYCSNLTISATDIPDLSNTESFSFTFGNCSSIINISSLNEWDISSVTDMYGMFSRAISFNGDISAWDTSSVTNMTHMFHQATSFNGDISAWDTSSVSDMSFMFIQATSFNGDISAWDTSSVSDMSSMFRRATSFNGDLSAWNTSSVEDMNYMFAEATSFNLDLSAWDTSSVADMSQMFWGATSFNQDLSAWNTSSVTNMSALFSQATSFNGNISAWNTSSVEDMIGMFYQATSFNGDISAWNTSSVTNMNFMFYQATSFNGDISVWDTSSVTNMIHMFYEATSFNQNLSNWDICSVTDMRYMFYDVELSTPNYDAILLGWEAQDVRDDVIFSGGLSRYSAGMAADARQRLIDDHGWNITDGGLAE